MARARWELVFSTNKLMVLLSHHVWLELTTGSGFVPWIGGTVPQLAMEAREAHRAAAQAGEVSCSC